MRSCGSCLSVTVPVRACPCWSVLPRALRCRCERVNCVVRAALAARLPGLPLQVFFKGSHNAITPHVEHVAETLAARRRL
eukprot:1423414-Prymnesium_polylepis.1